MPELFAAKDKVAAVKRAYYQGQASYEDMAAAAAEYLTLMQEAERRKFGRAKTKVNKLAIAALLR